MRTPTELELQHLAADYDPVAAREYYLRTRKLKGRDKAKSKVTGGWNKGHTDWTGTKIDRAKNEVTWEDGTKQTIAEYQATMRKNAKDPRTGKTKEQIHKEAVAKQKKAIVGLIGRLEDNLKKIEAMIQVKLREEASEDRKSKAKKERAQKENEKPKSAAEKAEAARESKKDRAKNQQKLKNKSDDKPDAKKKAGKDKGKTSVSNLKAMATKVKGKIAVAKQKLAAL